MNMGKRRANISNRVVAFLLMVMIALILAILWLGVPFLAEQAFGEPADYLTATQKWQYSLEVLLAKERLLTPVCFTEQVTSFTVESGSSVNQIASNLESSGLIRDASGFRSYLIFKGMDTQILAGEYQLYCSSSSIEIAERIKNIYQEEVIFVILPGWRAEEIAAALPSSGIQVTPEEFMEVVRNPTSLILPSYIPSGNSVEGFLFPGEYVIERETSAQALVQAFIDRFSREIPETSLTAANAQGVTPYQVVILASIVQKETFAEDERSMMASVFYNRLRQGMRLETDPTVQYALGYDSSWGWWKSPLDTEDLQIQSPYNTYQVNGLPPAPISNPDAASIQSVLSPSVSNYLYFRARCDGSGYHSFAVTFEEHLSNACD